MQICSVGADSIKENATLMLCCGPWWAESREPTIFRLQDLKSKALLTRSPTMTPTPHSNAVLLVQISPKVNSMTTPTEPFVFEYSKSASVNSSKAQPKIGSHEGSRLGLHAMMSGVLERKSDHSFLPVLCSIRDCRRM